MKTLSYFSSFICIILLVSLKNQDEQGIKIGDKVSFNNREFLNIDSKKISLESQIAKNGLIVIFSCNTCPFVVGNDNFEGWEKQYSKLYEEAKNAEIGLVLVNSNEGKRENEDSFDEMKKHAKKLDYKMPYLVDENSELANLLSAKTTPHVFVFDSESVLIYSGTIDNSWDTKRASNLSYLENVIGELKNSTKTTVQTTEPRGCSIKRVKTK